MKSKELALANTAIMFSDGKIDRCRNPWTAAATSATVHFSRSRFHRLRIFATFPSLSTKISMAVSSSAASVVLIKTDFVNIGMEELPGQKEMQRTVN
jgi:hypothetical protein